VTRWRNQPYTPLLGWCAAIVMMVLALSLANAVTPRPGIEKCVSDEMREKIQKLMVEGLDESLKAHTRKMVDIWVQDDTDQPRRAVEGMRSGIRAYIRARAAALSWAPPTCN
jgi:tRNA A37 N6-isopentenylltransferase MiaA